MSHEYLARLRGTAAASRRDAWRKATSGSASPLPHGGAMERLFGQVFSRVSTFLGRREALDALGANAATDGRRMAFASQSPSKRQVAHELAHVVQIERGGGTADASRLSEPGSSAEREADRAAVRAGRGEAVSIAEAAPAALHRDIKEPRLEVPHGTFKIDMTKKEGAESGEKGNIYYHPKPTAPDSKAIALTQVVETFDLAKADELNWTSILPAEGDRDKMRSKAADRTHVTKKGDTLESVSIQHFGSADHAAEIRMDNAAAIEAVAATALADPKKPLPAGLSLKINCAVTAGYFVDHPAALPDATPRTKATDPAVTQDYVRPHPSYAGGTNQMGSKKGKTIVDAALYDFPRTSGGHISFNFQTVARSDDIGLYYGTLWWQFEVDATGTTPQVINEAKGVKPGATDTFRSAVVEFNRFYANPHTVMKGQTLYEISRLYFGSADRADDIFKANEKLIGKRDAPLKIGCQLRIPDVTDTLKKP
jgi:LysM repeat protein